VIRRRPNRVIGAGVAFVAGHGLHDRAGKRRHRPGARHLACRAYALNALRDWAGDEAEIRELGLQFRAINHKHDVLRATGVVTDKKQESGENLVMLDINVLNQKDEKTAPGRAVVVLLSRAEHPLGSWPADPVADGDVGQGWGGPR
jgi:hypothetical protein